MERIILLILGLAFCNLVNEFSKLPSKIETQKSIESIILSLNKSKVFEVKSETLLVSKE